MRSSHPKAAGSLPAAASASRLSFAGARGGGSVAPFLRRAPGALLGLVNGPRKPPQGRRVRDVAPGERVPTESRLVLRRGGVVEE